MKVIGGRIEFSSAFSDAVILFAESWAVYILLKEAFPGYKRKIVQLRNICSIDGEEIFKRYIKRSG
jgi:hypothetical protein